MIVPETNPDAVSQSINVPSVSDILTVPLSYDSSFGFSADLPSSIPVPGVTGGDVWKSQVLAVLEPNVNDAFPQKIASIPLNNAFSSIDFASVDGIIIKGSEDDNYFKTTVNVQNFPDNAGINDVTIKLTSGPSNSELISQIHSNGDFNNPIQSSLVGKKLLDGDLNFDLSIDWMRPGDTQVVTITGTPTITVLFDLKLTNPDSVTINVSDGISIVDSDVLTLPKFSDNTSDMGGCGVSSLFGGTIVPDFEKAFNASNKFTFKDVTSTFPFPVQLQIHFKNFFPETGSTDSVKIDEEVFGDDWVDIVKTIAGHQFKHSSGNDTISIDEFDVDFDIKTKKININSAIKSTMIPKLDIIPTSPNLSVLEQELVDVQEREYKVESLLNDIKSSYDYIFIDCPPSLGLLTLNALCAARSLIIPLQTEYYALEGLSQLIKTLESVKGNFNKDIELKGILLTMYDKRNKICEMVSNDVKNHFNNKVFKTVIPRNVRVSEAPSYGQPVLMYDISCPGSQAYASLAGEIINQETIYNEKK